MQVFSFWTAIKLECTDEKVMTAIHHQLAGHASKKGIKVDWLHKGSTSRRYFPMKGVKRNSRRNLLPHVKLLLQRFEILFS